MARRLILSTLADFQQAAAQPGYLEPASGRVHDVTFTVPGREAPRLNKQTHLLIGILGLAAALPTLALELKPDKAQTCKNCDAWNEAQAPFRVHGDTYYVGTAGLSAVLIDTGEGLILIDGALAQSAPLIDDNIRQLGFETTDIRIILNSHAHYDHAGGVNALQSYTGARVLASEASRTALSQGNLEPDDPQFGFGPEHNGFPAVAGVEVIEDRGAVRLGNTTLTLYHTPGHTPGGSTWTWQSCDDEGCLDIVYADSISAVSAEGYRFADGAAEDIRASAARIAALPCDLLLSPHPFLFQMQDKLAARTEQPDADPFIDGEACRVYGEYFDEWLDKRLAQESASEVIRLSEPVAATDRYEDFGSALPKGEAMRLGELVANSDEFLDNEVLVTTRIAKVCQKKGCFFIAQDGAATARVTFRDYGFFIPTDSSGKTVTLQGTFTRQAVTQEQAAHYASDLGETEVPSAAFEYAIVATAVRIPR